MDITLKAMIDSSVFLDILFGEGKEESFRREIEDLKKMNCKMAVTPLIYYEVFNRIKKHVDGDECIKNSSIIELGVKNKFMEYHAFLFKFGLLLENFECLTIHPQGSEFQIIMKECINLRLSPYKSDNDKLNVAIAISNGCKYFITGDTGIKGDERRIYNINNCCMKIICF